MLHTQSEEDSSAGRKVGRDFFQVLPENNREYSPGLFPQEVRKEIPTFARKQSWGGLGVEDMMVSNSLAKIVGDSPAPLFKPLSDVALSRFPTPLLCEP